MILPLTLPVLILVIAGCGRTPIGAVKTTGPVPLKSDQQMRRYLCGGSIRVWTPVEPLGQRWRFRDDGTFDLWIEGVPSLMLATEITDASLPSDAQSIRGAWSATKSTLTLTNVTSADGVPIESFTRSLQWVDGKLRIGIASHRFMHIAR